MNCTLCIPMVSVFIGIIIIYAYVYVSRLCIHFCNQQYQNFSKMAD